MKVYKVTNTSLNSSFTTRNIQIVSETIEDAEIPENHWQEHVDMVVYDLNCSLYTIDGKAWEPIAIDEL